MGDSSKGVGRETRARVSTRSPRKAIGGILGCCPNLVVLDGPPKGTRTLKVRRGVATNVPGKPAIDRTGVVHELIQHAISLTTPATG